MNIVKNILNQFENSEQAKLTIEYCSVDNEYTVEITCNGIPFCQIIDQSVDIALEKAFKLASGDEIDLDLERGE